MFGVYGFWFGRLEFGYIGLDVGLRSQDVEFGCGKIQNCVTVRPKP